MDSTMRTSPWPTITSFAVSALIFIAIGVVGRGSILTIGAFLAAVVFASGACDMAVRAYRSRRTPRT